jgi:hypothetical protein
MLSLILLARVILVLVSDMIKLLPLLGLNKYDT